MKTLHAERVLAAVRRGSSCPVIVATAAGNHFTKLRGARSHRLLLQQATRLGEWDGVLADQLRRDVIEAAVDDVPDDFLRPLLPPHAPPDALRRRRASYTAFLWKRLKAPRPFVTAAP